MRRLISISLCSISLCLFATAASVTVARAQTDLGGQRVATSSGTFLKIGLDARASALGGAYNALASGPNALFYNPAGIVEDEHTKSLALSYADWFADLSVGAIAATRDLPALGSRRSLRFFIARM